MGMVETRACSMTNDKRRKLIQQAIDLLRNIDSLIEIDNLLAKHPGSDDSWKLRVRLQIILDDLEKALTDDKNK